MKRTAVVLSLMCTAAAASVVSAAAQTSALVNGVYSVTVTGSTTEMEIVGNPRVEFSLPGVLFVFASPIADRPAELCLFVNDSPDQAPVTGSVGAIWLASWLGCGQLLGHGGGWFSASDSPYFVGQVVQSATSTDALYVAPSRSFTTQQTSFQVFENMFLAPHSTIPQLVSGGWWGATTSDGGNTVFGTIELQGYKSGWMPGLALARYSATFRGELLFRMN